MSQYITVQVIETAGSVPREAGTVMHVYADSITGTIGGGSLEWAAMARARQMLKTGDRVHRESIALGPDMGQCCGGRVTLEYGAETKVAEECHPPLYIWGAGHVGRAIASVLAPFETLQVTLIDVSADRLPDPLPERVTPLVATDPLLVLPRLPINARHLIVTYSHQLDLSLCDALLRHGFVACGLIGSKTKWARFRSRLKAIGHSNEKIQSIHCPIGDPALGKHPQAIAISVAHGLLSVPGHVPAHDVLPGEPAE